MILRIGGITCSKPYIGASTWSIAAMASLWLLKMAVHRLVGSGLLGALRIQRDTVRSEISKPSIFQFTMNARCASSGVLGDHAEDEISRFSADALPACPSLVPREPRPIQFETGSVSSRNRLRLDKNQRLLPATPNLPQHHPKQSVRTGQSRLRMPSPQDRKLLPKRHVFQEQVSAGAKESGKRDK
jgi:hypothetical protein